MSDIGVWNDLRLTSPCQWIDVLRLHVDGYELRSMGTTGNGLPHVRVGQLVVDRDVHGVRRGSLNQSAREDPIDQDGLSVKTVGGDVPVGDVEYIIDIGGESGGDQSKLGESLE